MIISRARCLTRDKDIFIRSRQRQRQRQGPDRDRDRDGERQRKRQIYLKYDRRIDNRHWTKYISEDMAYKTL